MSKKRISTTGLKNIGGENAFRASDLPNIIFPKISRYRTNNIVMQSFDLDGVL